MFLRIAIVIFFLGWFVPNGYAQSQSEYITKVSSFSIEDGLSSRFVEYIYEDSRGFIWLNTIKGLNLFDGKEFKVFFENKNDLHYPAGGKIVEDVNGNIWPVFLAKPKIGRYLIWHSLITPNFETIPIDEFYKGKIPFSSLEIISLHQTPSKTLYFVLTSGQIYKFDGVFSEVAKIKKEEKVGIRDVNEAGKILLRTDTGVLIIEEKTGNQRHINQPEDNRKTDDPRYEPMFFDEEIYWTNALVDLSRIEELVIIKIDGTSRPLIKDITKVREIVKGANWMNCVWRKENDQDYFYLIANQILIKFDWEGNFIYDYSKFLSNKGEKISLKGVVSNLKDRLWLATNEGFSILEYKVNPFKQILNRDPSRSTRSILPHSNGNILIVAHGGVFEWDPFKDEIKKIPLAVLAFYSCIEIEPNKLLFGMHGPKLVEYDMVSGISKNIQQEHKEYVRAVGGLLLPFKDTKGEIWIGGKAGLYYHDQVEDLVKKISDFNEFEDFKNKIVKHMYEDPDGIWLATSSGLYLMDSEKGIIDYYDPIPDLEILHFYRDGNIFWLATKGDGLIKWNKKTGTTKKYSIEQGFPDDRLVAVYPDDFNNLWIPSYNGLIRFNRTSEVANTFLTGDGITHDEFNQVSHYQDQDGRLFFGGLNGINVFHPKDIEVRSKSNAPLVPIGYSELEGKSGSLIDKTSAFCKNQVIELKPDIKSFQIHFALLNYDNADKTRYAYRIKGFDKNWNYQKENYLRINNLPYGDYTLEIKAQDYTGHWSPSQLAIPVKVNTPFYTQRKWQLIGVGLLAFSFLLAYKWRLRVIERENKKLEQEVARRTRMVDEQRQELAVLNDTKDRLFAILAHDLRNPVIAFEDVAKSINYLLHSDQPERVLELGNYIEKEAIQLHHLLDNILNWAMSQRDELPVTATSLELTEVVDEVLKNNWPLAKRMGIELKKKLNEGLVVLADRRVLETVFRNLISNALRYTKEGGWIKIEANQVNKKIQILIIDNGLGMTALEVSSLFKIQQRIKRSGNMATVSLGLHLCRELMELLNGSISATSEQGKGTTLILELPIGN